jgi:phosphoenolpyruvate synthase/pyruvate phosphate dikinase
MMRYIITLNNVNQYGLEMVGFRAMDLANLKEKRLNIPLAFVINNQAFEDFIAENGLRPKIESLLKKKNPAEAYPEILELFKQAEIPGEILTEISEGYDSLTIEPGSDASSIVSKWDLPFVTLFKSPSYLLATEDNEGIIQNIKGMQSLAASLKHIWASIYSPRSVNYRSKTGIKGTIGLGVLVEKMRPVKQSAIVYSRSDANEKTIVVKSFFGLPDYGFDKEILGKDSYEVDLNSLSITNAEINVQEYAIQRDFDSEELIEKELREEGAKQKINDKLVSEVARIAKRAKSFIEKDVKLYFGIKDDYIFVFLANRMIVGSKKILESVEEIEVKFDEKGKKIISEKKDFVAMQSQPAEAFAMPKILSGDEAKEELVKEGKIEIPEEAEAEYETEEQLNPPLPPPPVDVYEEKTKQEEQVEKEVSLLEEMLQIKEITERMEEHALNNNKEAYEREARILNDMIRRVKRGE